jgi:hypothetical protein
MCSAAQDLRDQSLQHRPLAAHVAEFVDVAAEEACDRPVVDPDRPVLGRFRAAVDRDYGVRLIVSGASTPPSRTPARAR